MRLGRVLSSDCRLVGYVKSKEEHYEKTPLSLLQWSVATYAVDEEVRVSVQSQVRASRICVTFRMWNAGLNRKGSLFGFNYPIQKHTEALYELPSVRMHFRCLLKRKTLWGLTKS